MSGKSRKDAAGGDGITAAVTTTTMTTSSSSTKLRAPLSTSSFLSTHRRRSKTYSGEEFAQHFSHSDSAVASVGGSESVSLTSSTSAASSMAAAAAAATGAIAASGNAVVARGMRNEENPKDLPKIASISAIIRKNEPIFNNRRLYDINIQSISILKPQKRSNLKLIIMYLYSVNVYIFFLFI